LPSIFKKKKSARDKHDKASQVRLCPAGVERAREGRDVFVQGHNTVSACPDCMMSSLMPAASHGNIRGPDNVHPHEQRREEGEAGTAGVESTDQHIQCVFLDRASSESESRQT